MGFGSRGGAGDHEIMSLRLLQDEFLGVAFDRHQPFHIRFEAQPTEKVSVKRLAEIRCCKMLFAVQHGNFTGEGNGEPIRDLQGKFRVGAAAHSE